MGLHFFIVRNCFLEMKRAMRHATRHALPQPNVSLKSRIHFHPVSSVRVRPRQSVRLSAARLTRFVSWVSIMKLWTCFSALESSSFLETTATRSAVQPAP